MTVKELGTAIGIVVINELLKNAEVWPLMLSVNYQRGIVALVLDHVIAISR